MSIYKPKTLIDLDSDDQPFELLLSETEFKALQNLLPRGFSLTVQKQRRVSQKCCAAEKISSKLIIRELNEKVKKKAVIKPIVDQKPNFELVDRCNKILDSLKRHPSVMPFIESVKTGSLDMACLSDVIKEHMDISTIETKLNTNKYNSIDEFYYDIKLIWFNALQYYAEDTKIYQMAKTMETFFENLLKSESNITLALRAKVDNYKKKLKSIENRCDRAKKCSTTTQLTKPLSYNEKKSLCQMIRSLPNECLWSVWNIVSNGEDHTAGEIEFDIDTLDVKVARELEKFVKNKLIFVNKKKRSSSNKFNSNDNKCIKIDQYKDILSEIADAKATPTTETIDQHNSTLNDENGDDFSANVQPKNRVDNEFLQKDSNESSFIDSICSDDN